MRDRLPMVLLLVLVCFGVALAQEPVRGTQSERLGSGRNVQAPRPTPRTIRLKLPRRDAKPTSPMITPALPARQPTSPGLRVTEEQDPTKVVVARVGSEQMTLKELEDQLALLRRGRTFGGRTEEVERLRRAYREQILNDWVETKLFAIEARARQLAASREEVDRYIEGTAQDRGMRISLADRLRALGLSEEKLRDAVTEAVLGEKLIRQTIREKVTDAMIRDAYARYPLIFWSPPKRHVRQIIYQFRGGETPRQIRAMKRKMNRIRRRLVWFGGKFEDYSTQEYADLGLYVRDLGWLTLGDHINVGNPDAPDLHRLLVYNLAFQLKKVRAGSQPEYALKAGKISDVARSPYGFHIFQVVAEQPARRKTTEEARLDVENTYYEQVRTGLLEQLRRKYDLPAGQFLQREDTRLSPSAGDDGTTLSVQP